MIESHSQTWFALKEYYTARLEILRNKLENTQPMEQTERLRGQIVEIRHLLDLEKKTTGDK